MRAPTLIIGYGNPSRGDDALGPAAAEAMARIAAAHPEWGAIEVLTDFQLQVEFVTDLAGRQRVVFIDAAASGPAPFSFSQLHAREDASATSHALSPAALLDAYQGFYQAEASPSFLLAIRGGEFALGAAMSAQARSNLDAAMAMLQGWLNANAMQPIP